MTAWVLRVGYF